ncbi:MAG: CoA transferase [Gammaproteobacteria bacterium]|nr:CoA transferase [Gammaproteobacteria bacterium]
MARPLRGLLVIALEQAVAAPLCTARLADAGARVIKIERADGDFARAYDSVVDGESAYFVWLNRGKESICLDIKDKSDFELLRTMLEKADVFIQNLAPGAAARAGLGSKALRAQNEKLITLDISGYGESGPYRDMKAYDLLVQCESGLASITGSPAEPGRVGVSICDIACGLSAHAAVLEALIERGRTGTGKSLHVSLFDSLADWLTVPLMYQEHTGQAPRRIGIAHPSIAPYGVYATKDGEIVIAIQNNREWLRFCNSVLQKPELGEHESYANNESRCANRDAMNAEITAVFSASSTSEIRGRLLDAGIAFASLNDLRALSEHPQLRRFDVATPSGTARLVAPPAQEDGVSFSTGPVPSLDEHGAAIRAEFGAGD